MAEPTHTPIVQLGLDAARELAANDSPHSALLADWIVAMSEHVESGKVIQGHVPEAPKDGKTYVRQDGTWVEATAGGPAGVPEAPTDGRTYGRKNGAWELSVGQPVVVSAGAVAATPITMTASPFALKAASPNIGGYWDHTGQRFVPPAGAYQVNGTLSCVSTNNSADAQLIMYVNGTEFARVTAGATAGNIMSATLALALVTNQGDIVTFKMMADRADMTVATPGSGLSIMGRSFVGVVVDD